MTRVLSWIGIVVATLVALVVLLLAFFPLNAMRGTVAHGLAQRIDRPVSIAGLHGHLLSATPRIELTGLKIGNPAWAGGGDMAVVQRVDLVVRLFPLFIDRIILPRVEVVRPELYLYADRGGRANWVLGPPPAQTSTPSKNTAPNLPVLHQLVIQGGRLRMTDEQRKLTFSGTVSAQEAGVNPRRGQTRSNTEPFELKGDGSLNGKPFTLRVTGGPLISAERHKPYPFDVEVTAADIRASARGLVPKPFDLNHLQVRLSLSGSDLADGYYLTGLALPNTPPYSISGNLVRSGLHFDFHDLVGRLGRSDLHGRILVDMSTQLPVLKAELESERLRFADLGTLFGAQPGATPAPSAPAVKSKPQKQTLAPAARFLLPTAPLDLERVRSMNARVHYRAQSVAAGKLPLQKVDLTVTLDHGLLSLAPFAVTLPQGTVIGDARIDARGAPPRTDIDVRLTNARLDHLFPGQSSNPPLEGRLLGRVRLRGSGDSVHKTFATANGELTVVIPHGEVRQAFDELTGIDVAKGLGLLLSGNKKDEPIECGVADFHAHNGDFVVQALVIDTKTVLITGNGHVNMGLERIQLDIHGKPKKFALFRVRTPIKLGGTLLHPTVGVSTGTVLGQAAIATALSVAATPIAAIAAFVDPGLNKNADCAALLRQSRQRGAPIKTATVERARRR